MKKSFLLCFVMAALAVFCSAAAAQRPLVPTLQTVSKDGTTTNVFTYRDSFGKVVRELEYFVNDDGSYGNKDSYYDGQGNQISFIRTEYKVTAAT